LSTHKVTLFPFNFQVKSDIPEVIANIRALYPTSVLDQDRTKIIDYALSINQTNGVRRFVKKQARFLCDYREPFKPLNYSQAYAMLEWGMNWTVAAHEMQYVIVHSAVLAKNGRAILFPAPPGSGKSTLTAHLAFNGWQLLSDEMALIDPLTNRVSPFVRPICLKNSSIALAKQWFSQGKFSSIAHDTHKGDVIHLSPPQASWDMAEQSAEIVGIVFPNYRANQELQIYQLNQAQTFMQLAENAFNFMVLGEKGFRTLTHVVENTKCFEVFHNNLNDVQAFLEEDVVNYG
jgi:HprK-related kinase A